MDIDLFLAYCDGLLCVEAEHLWMDGHTTVVLLDGSIVELSFVNLRGE